MKEKTEEILNKQFGHVCEWDEKPPEVTVIDAPCHCGARVICSKASEEAEPLHVIKGEQLVHLQGLVILNKTDTRLDGVFSGCVAGTEKTACTIGNETGVLDNEWKGAGKTVDEGEGKDEITKENAYMVCERGDTNENCVRDEEDEYIFDDRECTMEEWILKKEVYLYVGDDGWIISAMKWNGSPAAGRNGRYLYTDLLLYRNCYSRK